MTGDRDGGTVRGMRIGFLAVLLAIAGVLGACKRESGTRAEPAPTAAVHVARGQEPLETPFDYREAWQAQQKELRENTNVVIKAACRRPAIAEPGDWVAVDADFTKLPGVRIDPDDFVAFDTASGKATGNAAFPIPLAPDGSRGSWDDPALLANERLRVLFLFSGVPAGLASTRLAYQEAVLGDAAKVEATCPKRIHEVVAAEFAQQ